MSIVIALIIFSVIVIIHEFGHFLLAKKNGIKVPEFSLGMGPRLFSFQKNETKYSLKLFPIGGSCLMLGQDEDSKEEGTFNSKGVWARISVIAAGPIFNFILAFVLAIFVITGAGYDPATVARVVDGQPASEAGIKVGDLITSINGKGVDISRDIDVYFQFHPVDGEVIEITYERNGKEYEANIEPKLIKRYLIGFSYTADDKIAVMTAITPGGALEKAGVKAGDIIVNVDGNDVKTGMELNDYFNANPLTEKPVQVTYSRDGKETTVQVTPVYSSENYVVGMGYNMQRTGTEKNPLKVLKYSYTEVKFWIKTTVASLGQLIQGNVSKDDIAGPVGIVNIIGDSYENTKDEGVFMTILQMMYISILLSANLGVMNLLPIPALDGGRLVFLIIEAIRGKPIPAEKEGIVHVIGFIALMLLMVFVVFNDIMRIFG